MACSRVTLNSVTVGGLIKELHFYNCTPNEGDHDVLLHLLKQHGIVA